MTMSALRKLCRISNKFIVCRLIKVFLLIYFLDTRCFHRDSFSSFFMAILLDISLGFCWGGIEEGNVVCCVIYWGHLHLLFTPAFVWIVCKCECECRCERASTQCETVNKATSEWNVRNVDKLRQFDCLRYVFENRSLYISVNVTLLINYSLLRAGK